jgi:hypothetical protein
LFSQPRPETPKRGCGSCHQSLWQA